MSDLFDDAAPASNTPEFTVGELTGAIKKTIEGSFGRVRVRGEVGRVMRAGSGHLYYDLKDDRNVINCTTWRGQVAGLGMVPEEGLEVIVTGKLSTYGPASRYNLNVDSIEVAGEGALMAMLEKRRKALAAEGLFDAARKRPLPYLPEVIGVVTSPSGAVIRDILHRLRDRFPRNVLVWPVTVQGERCAPEVAQAIAGFNALTKAGRIPQPDVMIVARGGGSIEDLWGFNEEAVVRAVVASGIPVISAVGHETDTTLIDHAADQRAPTPTAAAEMAVPVRADLAAHVASLEERRRRSMAMVLDRRGQRLRDLSRALPRPDGLLGERRQGFDAAADRLPLALGGFVQRKRLGLSGTTGRLHPDVLRGKIALSRAQLGTGGTGLKAALRRRTDRARTDLARLPLRVRPLTRDLGEQRAALARVLASLAQAETRGFLALRDRLTTLSRMLASLGYTETLRRGFAVVRDGPDGALVHSTSAAQSAAVLEIEFSDGRVTVGAGRGAAAKSRKAVDPDNPQGSLF